MSKRWYVVHAYSGFEQQVARALREAALAPDVAVLLTSSVKDRMALNVETLLVSPYRLWLPLGHPLAQQESITLEELAGTPMIQLMVDEIEESTRRLTAALPVKPQIAFRTRSVEAVRSLVATGAGIAVLPDLAYRPWSLEGKRIETVTISDPVTPMSVGLAWHRERAFSPAMQAVRNYFHDAFLTPQQLSARR